MKKSSLILAIIFLISMSSFQVTVAQEKNKEDKDKELNGLIEEQKKAMVDQKKVQVKTKEEKDKELNEVIEEQKKAFVDQKKAQEEVRKAMENSRILYEDAMGHVKDTLILGDGKFQKAFRDFGNPRNGWIFNNEEPFIFSPGVGFYGHPFNNDSEITSFDFSKSIKESTFTREYIFDVEETAKNVVMSINGDCKSGDIHIKITMPDGKVYSDIVIDEAGNLNWRKSFVISDEENKEKVGAWKFDINSSKATGYFKISIQTY
jgi:hypothetical protein